MREYELMYVVRPDVDDAGLTAAMDAVKSIVEANGGELLKTTVWGKRRLAYTVNHLRDGFYVIVRVNLATDKVAPVERTLRINDAVFRHLLVTTDNVAELPESALITADAMDEAEDEDELGSDEDEEDEFDDAEEAGAVAVGAEVEGI